MPRKSPTCTTVWICINTTNGSTKNVSTKTSLHQISNRRAPAGMAAAAGVDLGRAQRQLDGQSHSDRHVSHGQVCTVVLDPVTVDHAAAHHHRLESAYPRAARP